MFSTTWFDSRQHTVVQVKCCLFKAILYNLSGFQVYDDTTDPQKTIVCIGGHKYGVWLTLHFLFHTVGIHWPTNIITCIVSKP